MLPNLHCFIIFLEINAMSAAAKSLHSCPTLCDPIDGSPPGSPIPGILQARTLEWVGVRNAVLGCNLKNDRMISVRYQGKPFNITVIQVYSPTSNAEEVEVEWFYEDLQGLLEITHKKISFTL